jgi:Ca2+-binding RTX toxin-like protein
VIGGFGTDMLFGDAGADLLAGGQGSDQVNGGPGEDVLIGDIPDPENGLPPTPDPTPNLDRCNGAAGPDTSFLCEANVAVESIDPP